MTFASAIDDDFPDEPSLLLLQRALEMAADTPHGFTVKDFERLEAYRLHLDGDVTWGEYVVALSDGRRFSLTYDYGVQLDDAPDAPPREVLEVKQMMTSESLPDGSPAWECDVGDINGFMGERLVVAVRAAQSSALH